MNTEQSPPQKRGCFFYGCLSSIILSLVIVLIGYLGFRYLTNRLLEFTDTKPAQLESVQVTAAQLEALRARVAVFGKVLQEQKVSQELRLSAEDLNALIENEPSLNYVKNRLFVMIDGDRIQGQVSWPLANFGPLKLKGRYLNGLATLKASLENGTLRVTLENLEVKGKPLPPRFMAKLKNQNLAQNAQNDPNTVQAIEKFESIHVKDSMVILKNKVKE
jgi:hypothetical protein